MTEEEKSDKDDKMEKSDHKMGASFACAPIKTSLNLIILPKVYLYEFA